MSPSSAVLTEEDEATDSTSATDRHFAHSVLRERVAEHVFIGELLRRLWQLGVTDVEVLRSEFDAGGYDVVFARGDIVRHVQFKTSRDGGKAASVKIGVKLASRPSGCVIWMIVSDGLELKGFRWFGGEPGAPLPAIDNLRVAKHTKANAEGLKAERAGHRVVPKAMFEHLAEMDDVIVRLFGRL